MNTLTKVFLVLLRLAIGWHFFFEGVEKVNSLAIGETTTNRPFTSAGYLGEATGPFGEFFRNQVRESDDEILNRLTVVPLASGQEAAKTPLHARMPPGLAKEWNEFLQRVVQDYHLDTRQIALAEKKLHQHEACTVLWLLEGRKKITKSFPTGTVDVEETILQRVEEYRKKAEEVRSMETKLIPKFGKDVLKEKLRYAKAELNQMRQQLVFDLNEHTVSMMKAILGMRPPISGPSAVGLAASPSGAGVISAISILTTDDGERVLSPDQKSQEIPADPGYASSKALMPLKTMNLLVSYGILVIGACLLLGLFSRLASLGGAAFLLMLYLSMPPFPWLPDPPRPLEGHYLFVSKNAIEMIALLTLATTQSGRWAGLDGLIGYCLRAARKNGGHESDIRSQKSEVRSHRSEDRSQRSEVRDQGSGVLR